MVKKSQNRHLIYSNICVCPIPFRSVPLCNTHVNCVHLREKQPGGCFESRINHKILVISLIKQKGDFVLRET